MMTCIGVVVCCCAMCTGMESKNVECMNSVGENRVMKSAMCTGTRGDGRGLGEIMCTGFWLLGGLSFNTSSAF